MPVMAMATFGLGQPTKIGAVLLDRIERLAGDFRQPRSAARFSRAVRPADPVARPAIGTRHRPARRLDAARLVHSGAGSSTGSWASLGGGSLGGKAGGCWNSATGGFVTAAGSSADGCFGFGRLRLRGVGLFARRRATRRRHQRDGKDAGRQRPSKTKNVHGYILYRKTFLVIVIPRRHVRDRVDELGRRLAASADGLASCPRSSSVGFHGAALIRKVATPTPSPMPKRIIRRIARIFFIGDVFSCMALQLGSLPQLHRACHRKIGTRDV